MGIVKLTMTAEATDRVKHGPELYLDRVEFGPKDIGAVPFAYINVIKQVRTEFSEAGIAELAESMIIYGPDDDGLSQDIVVGFDMHNPLMVAKLNRQQTSQYLQDHADFYKLSDTEQQKQADAIVTAPDGFTYILIAGERRTLAIRKNIDSLGIDDTTVDVISSIHENIDFMAARSKQMGENIHDRPSPMEEAANIRLDYEFLKLRRPNATISYTDVARSSGRKAGVVRDALAFTSMPQEIQDLSSKVIMDYNSKGELKQREITPLPYSIVVALKPLEEALRLKYNSLEDPEEPEDVYVKNLLLAFSNNLKDTRLKYKLHGKSRSADKIHDMISEKIHNVLMEARITVDNLFIDDESNGSELSRSETILLRSQLSLARTALFALNALADTKAFGPGVDTAAMLESVLAKVSTRDDVIMEILDQV